MHHCICRVYFITMYLVTVYVPVSLTCYVSRVPSHKLNFGARGFRVAALTVWNSLPADIRACTFYFSFIRHLKSFYFNNAF